LVIVPAAADFTITSIVTFVLPGMVPNKHVTVAADLVHCPSLGAAETKVEFEGS
jgi:hypothetical protein